MLKLKLIAIILFYSDSITPRLKYTVNFIFKDILGLEIENTNDREKFINSEGIKINYSESRINKKELFIKPHRLLFESDIEYQNVSFHDFNENIGLFLTDRDSDLPFDPFAGTFFLVTRYEEYTDLERDEHDRFEAPQSTASKYNFLKDPVIDQWAMMLKNKLADKHPSFNFPEREFNHISTIDIDNAYAYLHKGSFRTIGGFIYSFFNFNFKELLQRILVLSGAQEDPYNTYEYIHSVHGKFNVKPVYFYLFGRYGVYDKNISPANETFQELIKETIKYADIGIHPSYTSNYDLLQLKEELKKLAIISGKWIHLSRQHFLKLYLPKTYNNLIRAGISQDFSMGYASDIGFRAGTCTPFKFYNLKKEEETSLTIFPFPIMDVTLQQYLKLNPEQAVTEIEKMIKKIKNVKGTFVSLWHNESLSGQDIWSDWRMVFEKMFEYIYN